ncbi:Ubiquinone biosynthesis monooxygenase COQ6, mitochondrial, partial [Dichanthelium oligosanthes]
RCLAAAANRIRPLARAFCDAPASSADAASGGAPSSQDHTQEVGGVKAAPDVLDVAIVGGGMVGLAVACALCRVSTVTPATISFFKDIGMWEHVQQQRHAFFGKMQVWDYTGLGYTRYDAKDVGKEYLGCVVENKVLCNSLLLRLQVRLFFNPLTSILICIAPCCLCVMCIKEELDDMESVIYPTRLVSLTFPSKSSQAGTKPTSSEPLSIGHATEELHRSNLVKLDLSDGRSLYSKLVIGADGSKSNVRQIAGIKTTGWNYPQSAIICTVEHVVENDCAWQRFLPSGPIALLPIGNNFSNIVWTMSPEESLRHKSMSPEEFVKSVNHALDFGYGPHPRASALDHYMEKFFSGIGNTAASTKECFEVPPKATGVVSERMAFPLSLMHSHDYVSKRLALVGDAAHTVHPLAGQGVNLGFGDAAALAKVIAEGVSVGSDVGDLTLLQRYEKDRKAANVAMTAVLDGFQKMYSVDFGPLNVVRAAAFHGAQYISPLKRNIISYAMGDTKWPLFS